MRKLTYLLFIIIISFVNSYGQGENNNWYFGIYAGMTFNNDTLKALNNGALRSSEGCAAVSDYKGNLIFYTDGIKVWNKSHTQIAGPLLDGNYSATQGAVIVRHMSDTNLFYIFTTDGVDNVTSYKGLNYSIVDISANNGLGQIVSANNLLDSNASEKVCLALHADGKRIWLLSLHKSINQFSAYLIDKNGLDTVPITTNIGSSDTTDIGYMSVSYDGEKVVIADRGILELYDFNNATGKLSSPVNYSLSPFSRYYGVEFAPGNQYMYATELAGGVNLYQFDISSGDSAQIANSRKIVYQGAGSMHRAIKLGPDNRLYFSATGGNFISVIVNPDEDSSKLIRKDSVLMILPGQCWWGLPSQQIPVSSFEVTISPACVGAPVEIVFHDSGRIDSIYWDFGDPLSPNNNDTNYSVTHTYNNKGTYTINYSLWRYNIRRDLSIEIAVNEVPDFSIGKDTFLCGNDSLTLEVNNYPGANFFWSDSSILDSNTVLDSGTYWVQVDNFGCIANDTIHIDKFPLFDFVNKLVDTFSCEADTFRINVGAGANTYSWSTGKTDSIGVFTQSGKYYIEAVNGPCISRDSIDITFHPKPTFSLGNDTIICSTDSITLSGTANAAHQWSIGDTNQSIKVKQQGLYTLIQNTQYCEWKDTIQVDVQQQPSLNIGNDTVVCAGQKAIIGNAIPNGIKYTWSFRGDGTPKITADSQAIYSVIAFDGVCRAYDTMFVGVYTPQSINLGADTTLCQGTETLLNAQITRGKYLWNDGNQSGQRLIKTSGEYFVMVTDSVCRYNDTINVTFTPVPPLDLGLDTMLCQDEIHQVNINPQWERVQWDDGSTQYNRIFITEGAYEVTATYLNCQETDEIQIGYHPALPHLDLGADVDVCDPLFYPVRAGYSGYYPLVWNTGAKGNYIEVTETGDYIVSTAPHRCGQASDTIHITYLREKCNHHVPGAFSPNGDGLNDYFMPVARFVDVESMRIYNRWGELLYDGPGPWDGTYQGVIVPNGVYVYYIIYYQEVNGGRKKSHAEGTLYLIR